jgi:hypothetical protein
MLRMKSSPPFVDSIAQIRRLVSEWWLEWCPCAITVPVQASAECPLFTTHVVSRIEARNGSGHGPRVEREDAGIYGVLLCPRWYMVDAGAMGFILSCLSGTRFCLAAPARIRRMARDGTWLSVHVSPLHQCIDRRMDNDTQSPAISH